MAEPWSGLKPLVVGGGELWWWSNVVGDNLAGVVMSCLRHQTRKGSCTQYWRDERAEFRISYVLLHGIAKALNLCRKEP